MVEETIISLAFCWGVLTVGGSLLGIPKGYCQGLVLILVAVIAELTKR